MKAVKKVFDGIYVFLAYFGIFAVVAMALIVCLNVFSRLIVNHTFGWADEVALILIVWISMIGLALGVKLKLHISIEVFVMKLSDKVKMNIIDRISDLCALVLGIVMFYYGILLVQNGFTSTMAATQLPTAVEYIFVPVAGFLIVIDSIVHLIRPDRTNEVEQKIIGGEPNA